MDIPPLFLGLGAVLVLVGALIFLMGISKKWGILFPYIGMLLFASMSLPLDWNDRVLPTVWLPIQSKRSTFFFAMGAVALLMVVFQFGRAKGKVISMSALTLILMGFYAAMLRFVHDGPVEGAYSIVFAVCTLIPLLFVSLVSIEEPLDLLLFLRSTMLMNIVWLGMCAVQFLANPSYLTVGNQYRFVGILNNPQHSGALFAFLSVFVLWLLLNDPVKKYRIFYIALGCVNVICLLWSGSRTGLGMGIIGISAVMYTKAGRSILIMPLVAIAAYVGMKVVVDVLGIDFGISRLASTENTRDYAWWKLYTTGMQNPLFGVGTLESEKSENSWLFGFAAFGIGMLGLSILLTLLAMWECLRMIRLRFWLPAFYRPYSDLIVGCIAMYFAGAVLEGYMVSRVNTVLCLYIPIATAGAMFRKFSKEYHEAGYVEGDEYGSEAGDYGEYEGFGDEYGGEYGEDGELQAGY